MEGLANGVPNKGTSEQVREQGRFIFLLDS